MLSVFVHCNIYLVWCVTKVVALQKVYLNIVWLNLGSIRNQEKTKSAFAACILNWSILPILCFKEFGCTFLHTLEIESNGFLIGYTYTRIFHWIKSNWIMYAFVYVKDRNRKCSAFDFCPFLCIYVVHICPWHIILVNHVHQYLFLKWCLMKAKKIYHFCMLIMHVPKIKYYANVHTISYNKTHKI